MRIDRYGAVLARLVAGFHDGHRLDRVVDRQATVGDARAAAVIRFFEEIPKFAFWDELQTAIKKVDRKKGVMLFTDMFGGTPSNIALAFLGEATEVVTGVNLSMLIKFANHRDEKPLPELAKLVQEAAQKSIVIASQMLKGKK